MHLMKTSSHEDLKTQLKISQELKETTKDTMELIDFVETNREILEHLLLKIDKHT